MANASASSVAKNFVKAYGKCREAQKKYEKFVNDELPKLINSKPTKSEYTKIVALLLANFSRWDLRTSVCEWIDKWGLEFAKTIKYKGFEIKFYNGEYLSFRNGVRQYCLKELDKLKAIIDDCIDAEKKMPAIMAKLGLDKLCYETYECKRSTVFEKVKHNFADEMVCSLYKFWMRNPNFKEWKVKVERNMCSHTREELAYECRSECEYSYDKGDYVCIDANGFLDWGACPR
jgi:hypothetical protein